MTIELLTKEEIDNLNAQLDFDSSREVSIDEYYNFWDFGKEPDESYAVSSLSSDLVIEQIL